MIFLAPFVAIIIMCSHTKIQYSVFNTCICMYVCMFVCMCIYVCTYVCMYVFVYVCVCVCVCVCIQGVPGGMCQTSGECFLC